MKIGLPIVFLVALFCVLLAVTNGQIVSGIPAMQVGTDLSARADSVSATARAYDYEAEQLRLAANQTAAREATQVAGGQQTASAADFEQTRVASQQTAAVASQQTQVVIQATIEAGQAQGTATAVSQSTIAWGTAVAIGHMATLDALAMDKEAEKATQEVVAHNLEIQNEQYRMEVARSLQYWPIVAIIALVVIGLFFGYRILRMKEDVNHAFVPRAQTGEAMPVIMHGQVVNADRMVSSALDPRKTQPVTTREQLQVTQTAQAVDATGRMSAGGYRREARIGAESIAARASSQLPEPGNDLPTIAPWADISSWRGGAFPLGIGQGHSGIVFNPEKTPHLLVAGTSGSGKTMEGLRPLTALALAAGYQVILMNEAGGDFAPLRSHPNLVAVPGEVPAIAEALESVAREVERRSGILNRAGISTWSRMADAESELGPRIMVVLDELVALAMQARGEMSGRIWRAAIAITSKGRKMGIAFLAGTTDPTSRTLAQPGLIVRDNCGRLVFRVRDRSVSQAALNMEGADALLEHQFYARLESNPVLGVAFHPSDDDLRRFLIERRVATLPAPAWLDVESKPVSSAPADEPEPAGTDPKIIEIANSIEEIWKRFGSKREMARQVGMVYEGNYRKWIDMAIDYLEAANANRGGNTPNSGNFANG